MKYLSPHLFCCYSLFVFGMNRKLPTQSPHSSTWGILYLQSYDLLNIKYSQQVSSRLKNCTVSVVTLNSCRLERTLVFSTVEKVYCHHFFSNCSFFYVPVDFFTLKHMKYNKSASTKIILVMPLSLSFHSHVEDKRWTDLLNKYHRLYVNDGSERHHNHMAGVK